MIISPRDACWSDVLEYSPEHVIDTFRKWTVFLYNFWDYLSVPHRDGIPVEHVQRPREMRIIASLTPMINGHNQCANGYFSLAFGIHLFGCQAHTDLKRLASRIGLAVHDSTIRRMMKAMTDKARIEMRRVAAEAAEKGTVEQGKCLDNVQRQAAVYEGGVLQQSMMKTGTYACEIRFYGVPPGAWNYANYKARVIANERSKMTVDSLWNDIDWGHYNQSLVLYCVKTLAEAIPVLSPHAKTVSDHFRSEPMAIHRLPDDHRTSIQPLGPNDENELETQGMKRSIDDFDTQIGYPPNASENYILWDGGDGAMHDRIMGVKKILAPTALSNHQTLRNHITTPEAWHVKSTAINAISENHFGPTNSSDPSSLSMIFHTAGLKRPSNTKKVDFYPAVHGFKLVWSAMVLDCWRYVHIILV